MYNDYITCMLVRSEVSQHPSPTCILDRTGQAMCTTSEQNDTRRLMETIA